jgi:hypothetical protein
MSNPRNLMYAAREWCKYVRTKPLPLADAIAMVQQLADTVERLLDEPASEPVAYRQWSSKWHDWVYQTERDDLRPDTPVEGLHLATQFDK